MNNSVSHDGFVHGTQNLFTSKYNSMSVYGLMKAQEEKETERQIQLYKSLIVEDFPNAQFDSGIRYLII